MHLHQFVKDHFFGLTKRRQLISRLLLIVAHGGFERRALSCVLLSRIQVRVLIECDRERASHGVAYSIQSIRLLLSGSEKLFVVADADLGGW